ncbi:ABC transporter ATP-binding protein [Spirochaeta dissipatitropha]
MNTERLIEVAGLGFTYSGSQRRTLEDISFCLDAGGIYGFLGPSGAGKSTTQKILYRLLQGYAGSVRLFGREISMWGTELYNHIGIGFETPNLYSKLSGRENLLFSLYMRNLPKAVPDLLDNAAERLGLAEALDARVETYSKGMRMRLSFLRAVLHKPALLFLDEPTSGLDPLWARKVKDWILELRAAGTAVFITTHSMELADELCDSVGFLVDGKLMLQDSPEALKRHYGKAGIEVFGNAGDGSSLSFELPYESLLNGEISEVARGRGISRIERVQNLEVSLEQVFLQVTGRRLEEDVV